MSKVILICGKICSGKTTYAKDIAKNMNAVILSTDELMLSLFGQYLGDKHDEMAEKTENYLYKKSVELISNGIIDDITWKKYLEKRNNDIVNNEQEFYYIDENIAKKFWNMFEEPKPDEMDVWFKNSVLDYS